MSSAFRARTERRAARALALALAGLVVCGAACAKRAPRIVSESDWQVRTTTDRPPPRGANAATLAELPPVETPPKPAAAAPPARDTASMPPPPTAPPPIRVDETLAVATPPPVAATAPPASTPRTAPLAAPPPVAGKTTAPLVAPARRAPDRAADRAAAPSGAPPASAAPAAGLPRGAAPAPPTSAPTLSQLTTEADLVVRAMVTEIDEGRVHGPDVPSRVRAAVLETLQGPAGMVAVSFTQPEAEQAGYMSGEEVLLFLRDTAKPAPGTAPAGPAPTAAAPSSAAPAHTPVWVNMQANLDTAVLTPASRPLYVRAVTDYQRARTLPNAAAQMAAYRRITVDLLRSGDSGLVRSALRDLARAPSVPLLTRAELPLVSPLVDDPYFGIENRIALLVELDRRQLVFGASRWVRFLKSTPYPEILTVIRAAGSRQSSDGITQELIVLLDRPDPPTVAAAAAALGRPGNHAAVEPLGRALASHDARVRQAALASLLAIHTQGARHMLELAAAFHPDPQVRAEAAVAAVVLARRHGTTLVPPADALGDRRALTAAPRPAPPARGVTPGG